PAHALNGLDDHRGRVAVDEAFDCARIVARCETHVEGPAREAVPFLERAPGHRPGGGGSAVETLFERDDLAAAGQPEGELQRVFVRFGAAIDPEHRVETETHEFGEPGRGALTNNQGN